MIKRFIVTTGLLILTTHVCEAQNLEDVFSQGKISGDIRAFWYDGQRALKVDRKSLTMGGTLSYQTSPLDGFQANVSFFSSNGITSLTHMPESGQTSNLKSDGTDINVLGEAALSYRYENTLVKYGRQRLDTPLTNDYYNRMIPNSFEAVAIEA
jgi:hypothetical protein